MTTQQSLFFDSNPYEPLASRVRPATLEEFAGQSHLLGEGKVLRQMVERDSLPSMIFWGPPGVGKTTLARIIAQMTKMEFNDFSAVSGGIKDIKDVMKQADSARLYGKKTIVFVDEIHRFNKAQQDAFLPYVEKGSIILIGATTENPSFEVNSALLSRCKVFVLRALSEEDVVELLRSALRHPKGFPGQDVRMDEELLAIVARFANGDARVALNTLEIVVLNGDKEGETVTVTRTVVEQSIGKRTLLYDKKGEQHYNIISALHKSMRNSDADAALYWTARMLEGGEDPLYIARRLIRFASEDVGLADSRALGICVNAFQACHFLGMPECNVHLAHAVVYLALSPKSRSLDTAYALAAADARESIAEPVPLAICNAPTKLMGELGYGAGYEFDPTNEYNLTAMECLPDNLRGKKYYTPSEFGSEARAKATSEYIAEWRREHCGKKHPYRYEHPKK